MSFGVKSLGTNTFGTHYTGAPYTISKSLTCIWGGEDFVSLAKEVTRIAGDKAFEPFSARGGVMDGEQLSAERVMEVNDGLPKFKDMPAEFGGSGDTLPD